MSDPVLHLCCNPNTCTTQTNACPAPSSVPFEVDIPVDQAFSAQLLPGRVYPTPGILASLCTLDSTGSPSACYTLQINGSVTQRGPAKIVVADPSQALQFCSTNVCGNPPLSVLPHDGCGCAIGFNVTVGPWPDPTIPQNWDTGSTNPFPTPAMGPSGVLALAIVLMMAAFVFLARRSPVRS